MNYAYISTLVIFILTYIALVCDSIPFVKLDRSSVALIGAIAIFLFTPFTFSQSFDAQNMAILCLLFGMMIVVAYLDISGFFKWTVYKIEKWAASPKALLASTVFLSGILSAFLINDIVCLALTPLIISICKRKQISALPYLIAVGTAANIGSLATLTGNPQNMLIGGFAHISYLEFACHAAPIAAIGLLVDYYILRYYFRKQLQTLFAKETATLTFNNKHPILLIKTCCITALVLILFFTKIPLAYSALGAAALLLLDKTPPKTIYHLIDWPLLILLASLFIIIGALELNVLPRWNLLSWPVVYQFPHAFIAIAAVILSNLVSNVPAVLLFKPLITHLPNNHNYGILVAAMSTFAGNITILGSLANLIVVTSARKHNVNISFWSFLKVGLPISLVTLVIAYIIISFY